MNKRKTTGFQRYLTLFEASKIIGQLHILQNPGLRFAIVSAYYLGLRVSDVSKLNLKDFNGDFTAISIIEKKTKKHLRRPLPDKYRELLFNHLREHSRKMRKGYLIFPYKNQSKNLHMRSESISLGFRKYCERIGLSDVYHKTVQGHELNRFSFHSLRHHFAMKAYHASEKDIKIVQKLLNHSSSEVTSRYVCAMISKEKEKDLLNNMFS